MGTTSISARVRGAHPASLAVALGVVVLLAANAWWLIARRSGMPLYLDEGGYLSTSMDWLHQLQAGGLAALGEAIELEKLQAPLTMLLTMPLQAITGGTVEVGFVVILAAYAVVLGLTYAVASRVADPWPAAIATLALAVAPETLDFARLYVFAMPATAFFVLGIYLYLRSEGGARAWWMIGAGAALGFCLLTRTLMLGFVLAPLIAAAVQIVARGQELHRRLGLLLGGLAVLVLVAATWYRQHLATVVDYLRGLSYRPAEGAANPDSPITAGIAQLIQSLYLPLFTTSLLIALAAGGWAWWRRAHGPSQVVESRPPGDPGWRRTLGSDTTFVGLVLLQIFIVIVLADEAIGQWLPALPLLFALVAAMLSSLTRGTLRTVLAGLLGLVCLLQLVSSLGLALTRPTTAMLTGRPLMIFDGRQYMEDSLATIPGVTESPGRLPPAAARIRALHADLMDWMLGYAEARGQTPVVYTDFADPLLNPNDLRLEANLAGASDRFLSSGFYAGLQSTDPADYVRGLSGPPAPNFVVVSDLRAAPSGLEDDPAVVEAALKEAGFKLVRSDQLADGRKARTWWRPLRGAQG